MFYNMQVIAYETVRSVAEKVKAPFLRPPWSRSRDLGSTPSLDALLCPWIGTLR